MKSLSNRENLISPSWWMQSFDMRSEIETHIQARQRGRDSGDVSKKRRLIERKKTWSKNHRDEFVPNPLLNMSG